MNEKKPTIFLSRTHDKDVIAKLEQVTNPSMRNMLAAQCIIIGFKEGDYSPLGMDSQPIIGIQDRYSVHLRMSSDRFPALYKLWNGLPSKAKNDYFRKLLLIGSRILDNRPHIPLYIGLDGLMSPSSDPRAPALQNTFATEVKDELSLQDESAASPQKLAFIRSLQP